jgi:type I restriction enzyme, S subunit
MTDWIDCKLGDLITLQRGHDLTRKKMKEGNIPVAGSNGIIGYHNESTTKAPGVTIGRSGNLGNAYLYTEDFWAHNTTLYVRDFKGNDEIFVYYFLKNIDFSQFNSGSAVPTLNRNHIHPLRISVPTLEGQKAIAAVLSNLDDKIDLLHRQNKTLESMAQALFRHWFIDNAADDWEECHVRDFVRHQRQSVKPQSRPMEIFIHYSLPAFDNDKTPIAEMGSEIRSNKYKVTPFSILVSKLNPRFPRIWDVYFQPETNSICSTEFQIMEPKSREYYGFISYLLKSDEAITELQMAASGTSGSHQRVKPADILNLSILIPNQKVIKQFSQMVEPNLAKIHSNRMQIRTLEKLRDTLLPKLMSGEVRVRQN